MPNLNRKLLVSVFDAQEAREAILGGGRIIDSEDPKSALGNIKPRHIMAISDAALDFKRDYELQLSTNIGEDQLLFRRDDSGEAIEKSPYEIAGKASQAAIGVAACMGTRVHPVSIVKVGLDGMKLEMLSDTLSEVVLTLQRTEHHSHTQVMSVLFAQDLDAWNARKALVRRDLVELREFSPAKSPKQPGAFDLLADKISVQTLRGPDGAFLYPDEKGLSLESLIANGVLPKDTSSSFVVGSELFRHQDFFPGHASGAKTSRDIIKAMVDATADAGAHAIMLDTSILSKVSDICLVDTAGSEMVDFNRHMIHENRARSGILSLDDMRFFVDYCHFRGLIANLAGSIDSYQAQMLWVLLPELDQVSVRGSASRRSVDPSNPGSTGADNRQFRTIYRTLVRGIAPPEHGGVLNLPIALQNDANAAQSITELFKLIASRRQQLGLTHLEGFWVQPTGEANPM